MGSRIGIGDKRLVFLQTTLNAGVQGLKVCVAVANQDRDGFDFVGNPQAVRLQAQEKVCPGLSPGEQVLRFERVDAHDKIFLFEHLHGLCQMREFHSRQAADVDDVGAVFPVTAASIRISSRLRFWRLGDFSEDPDIVAGQIFRHRGPAEIGGKILEFIGTPLDRHPELCFQWFQISAHSAGKQDAVDSRRKFKPFLDQLGGHQRGNARTDLANFIVEGPSAAWIPARDAGSARQASPVRNRIFFGHGCEPVYNFSKGDSLRLALTIVERHNTICNNRVIWTRESKFRVLGA